ncbi:myosin heavy chain, striated muscle-like [Daphnia carinata]|uniref:myosin heavy chain, striated muscle-like n=1 Tax=Daphnia carinata TaxID=120202 RepID=UPI00286972F8|nr:myosin heavy chain, striated muscle-like [Daphnia carinata]
MEKTFFGFPQPKFMTKKPRQEKSNGPDLPFITCVVSSSPQNPSYSETLKPDAGLEESTPQEAIFSSHVPSIFQHPFNSPTVSGANQPFSPSSLPAEFPFTSRRKPPKTFVTKPVFPVSPVVASSPSTPSQPASLVSNSDVEKPVIHRQQLNASLPSFFHRTSSECVFTPKRNQIKVEINLEDPSPIPSPTSYAEGNTRRFNTKSLFGGGGFSRVTGVNSEELSTETGEQRAEHENAAAKEFEVSEHSSFYRLPFRDRMNGEKYVEEEQTKTKTNWVDATKSDERKTSFESKLQAFTSQLLAAAEEAQSTVKAENEFLKKELTRAQKHIVNLEAQFDQLERNQSEAIKKANHLSVEKETLRDHLRNLQEQLSATEEELGKKQGQYEEMGLQLADKERRLNVTLDNIKSLEELTRSSDERVCELQTQLQLVLTDRTAADEKIVTMSELVDSLRENIVALELAMSDAEKKFQSTLSGYQDQQEKLKKEITFYQETVSALNDTRKEYDTVKGELGSCREELSKIKADSQAGLEENFKLKERLDCLSEQYATCEQSSRVAQENISTLERTISSQHDEIQQLNQRLETSSTELTNSREEVTNLSKELETLRRQTFSWQNRLSASEEKFQLELTKTQQELSCERLAHSETNVSVMAVFIETRNIVETQIKELEGSAIVAECENDAMKKEPDGEREAVAEEKLCWELCKDHLEASLRLLSAELCKVRSTIKTLSNENDSLKCQVNGLQENINVSKCQIESSKRELQNERVSHNETKSSWKQCKDELQNEKKEHSINLLKIQNTLHVLSGQKASLEAQVNNLEENVIAAERQNETIKQELSSERNAHHETKSNWKLCKEQLEDEQRQHSLDLSRLQSALQTMSDQKKFVDAQVTDLQSNLVTKGRNHESIRDKNLSLERQLEFAAIEISTLRAEIQEHSNRNRDIQALLDDIRMKSALSEESLHADLSKCRKELDSQQELQRETTRNLTETQFKLRTTEDICNQVMLERTNLQSDVAHLAKGKLENEETIKHLKVKIAALEKNVDTVTASDASLNQTLDVYEDFIKAAHQKCQLMFAEYLEAALNAKELTVEMKTLNENFETISKNAENVDEDLKNFNISFEKFLALETISSREIQNRLVTANSRLAASDEALEKAANEKSLLENAISLASAEKLELEKQLEVARENSLASEAILKQLHNRNSALEEMKTSLDQQIVDLEERVRSVEAELVVANGKVRDLQNDKIELEAKLESLHDQLQTSHYKCENAVGVLIAEKEQLAEKVKTLTETATNWKSSNEKFCARNSALKSSLIASGQQISDLHQRINTLDTELILSNEKIRDLAVEKTNLESQLGSLRHQLKESREKFNRDLEKLRHQLETEKASHENCKSRLATISTSHQKSIKLTDEKKQKCLKVAVELNQRTLDDKDLNDLKKKAPSPPLAVTTTNEKFQRRPLSDHHQQLERGKESKKNKAICGTPLMNRSPTNRSRDTVNNSTKITDVDKRDSRQNHEVHASVTVIEESPPAAIRKTRPRRAVVVANRSFPIQLEHESPSSCDSNGQRGTKKPDEISSFRERRKLFLTPSPGPSRSPTQNSRSVNTTPAKADKEELSDHDVSASSTTKPFAPVSKTYARKRLSMTARLVSANTASAQPSKKPRISTPVDSPCCVWPDLSNSFRRTKPTGSESSGATC